MDTKTQFEALSKAAYLDVLLPKMADFDAASLLRSASPDEIARVPARRNLFFGIVSRYQRLASTY